MCIKFIVFYTVVFSLKTVLSGVNINNGSNLRNTHQMYLNNQHNVQNGQDTNIPLDLPNISRNINHHVPILRQYDQDVKVPSHNPPLLQFRPPLNKARNQFLNEHVSLPNKRVENVHNSGNQFTVTSPRNDKVFINNIEGHPQRILKHEDNRPNNHLETFKMIPVGPVTERKNVVRTTTGLVKNENMKISMSSTLQPAPSVPHFDVKKQPSNKLKSHINDGQRSKINTFNHEKSAANRQGHIQPQRILQKPRNNIQTNHSLQNKRFTVIHDNGSVEYFEDLETILRKYPHIRIADNIRKLIPNQKPIVPLATARNSDINKNIKINPLVQNINVQNENLSPRTTVNTLKSTLKPKIESIIQPKNIPSMNKSNYNYGSLHTTTKLPVKVDNKNSEKLQTSTKESIKLKNNIPVTPSDSHEFKVKNFVTTTKNKENTLTTKSSDISDMSKKTPLKNMTAIDGNRQKPPIDVILNNDQIQYQENKANTSSVIPNNVNSQKVNSKFEKDDELDEDNLHLNDSKEVISSIVLQNKMNIKTVNSTSENKPDIINNNSSSNHDTVEESKTQPNCTKTNEFTNQLKTNNNVVINQKDAEEMGEDYDEDLLSLAKPLMWFSTTDPDFWKKLVSVDDNPNFLYIINVQSQPKIEKDRKTTIHANGTIVEEITETIWNAGDDVRPKITKTIKVTPAKADNDGI